MAFKSYLTINGKIHGEVSGGVATGYATDALGSVVATVDNSGNVANTYRYKPYGATLVETGESPDQNNQWLGSWGYRYTGRSHIELSWDNKDFACFYGVGSGRITALNSDNVSFDRKKSGPYFRNIEKPHYLPWQGRRGSGLGWQYGSYCGSSNEQNPASQVIPQDKLDSCCRDHDRCLEAHYGAGRGQAEAHKCCDQTLLRCATWVLDNNKCAETYLDPNLIKKPPSYALPLPPPPDYMVARYKECIRAAEELRLGIMSSLNTFYLPALSRAGQSEVSCIPEKDWELYIRPHWGDPRCKHPGGTNAHPPMLTPGRPIIRMPIIIA